MKKLSILLIAGVALSACNKEPEVTFTATPTEVEIGEVVQFENTTEKAFNYVWDFGDGGTSTALNPTHVYTEAGEYTVSLQASKRAKNKIHGFSEATITVTEPEEDVLSEEEQEKEDELAVQLKGVWQISSFEETNDGCDIDMEYEDFSYTTDVTVEFLMSRNLIITDHFSNVSNGNWSLTEDRYLTLNGLFEWVLETNNDFQIDPTDSVEYSLDDMYSIDLSSGTMTLTAHGETLNNAGTSNECTIEIEKTLVLTKQ